MPATTTCRQAPGFIDVINGATCHPGDLSGCAPVAKGTFDLAVSVKTDTVYAPATGAPSFNGHTVAVVNGATCNGTNHSGCGHLAATVHVGLAPLGVAVNDQTHTAYVTNNTLGDTPGTVWSGCPGPSGLRYHAIFTRKDGITWQGNTGSSLLSSVKRQPAWSWKLPGRSLTLPASAPGRTRPRWVTGCGPTVRSTLVTSHQLQLSERARLRELEKENRELRMKNDFLSKAAAYFAAEHR